MGIFDKVSSWYSWKQKTRVNDYSQEPEETIDENLALAVLMIAAARADGVFDPAEQQAASQVLQDEFGLSSEEAGETLAAADRLEKEAIEFFNFVQEVVAGKPYAERLRLLRLLFRVIAADGEAAYAEEEKLKRIAWALGVSTADYGKAKAEIHKII